MSEAKPTPGPWEAVMYERGGFDIASQGGDGITICSRIPFRRLASEMTANAHLIADAGTVFHTTGLTPSQLVERVKELERALMVAVNQNEHDMLMTGEELRAARAALSKARPNTAEGE